MSEINKRNNIRKNTICKKCDKQFLRSSNSNTICNECKKLMNENLIEFKPEMVKCLICDKLFLPKSKLNKICSDICREQHCKNYQIKYRIRIKHNIKEFVKRKNIINYKNNISKTRLYLREYCPYCRQDFGKVFHIDHIIPKKLGGLDLPSNLIKVCSFCNLSKSEADLLIWAEYNNYKLSNEIINLYRFNLKIILNINNTQNEYLKIPINDRNKYFNLRRFKL